MSKTTIKSPSISIRPSSKLIEFIKTLDDPAVDLPENLLKVYQAFSQDTRPRNIYKPRQSSESVGVYSDEEKQLLVALSDDTFQGSTDLEKCMKSLTVHVSKSDGDDDESHNSDVETLAPDERISKNKARQIRAKQRQKELAKLTLNLADLKWLHSHLNGVRPKVAATADDGATEASAVDTVPYLHELVEGSQLILPANEIVERNPELEARCQRLKLEQDEYKYRQMTKNVDCARTYEPEETISYQGKIFQLLMSIQNTCFICHFLFHFTVKLMNRQLIAVAQFIFSVAAGFAFGFIGVELLVGSLDFGFRLLLGIICALIIALAEIYFLAKKLNEEIDEAEQLQQKLFNSVQTNPNADNTTTNTTNTTTTASASASASNTKSKAQNQKEHND